MSEPVTISRGLINATAEALAGLSREVEGLGAALCADPAIAERFLDQLQGVDRVAQSLEQIANVLRAPVPEEAIKDVRVGKLQDHLRGAHDA